MERWKDGKMEEQQKSKVEKIMRKCIKKQVLPFASHLPHLPHFRLHSHNTQHKMHQTTQNKPITHNNQQSPRKQTNIIYFTAFRQYECEMCVSYLYYKPFLGIRANDRPPPLFVALRLRCLLKKIFSENFDLRIKIVLWKFLFIFFYL